ncbi:MAG: lysine--tRNA ligase [Planctomycetota bacterium]|jgi:lysyl-tRNA synthetase class 2|nr:lysine--tRNA ligase [Planctomycetota bacterium]MDP7249865.1 lysine--tRNA ligase [Planctomycetota bacterium]
MSTEDEYRQNRMNKLEGLREQGVEPYPYRYVRSHVIHQIREQYGDIDGETKSEESIKTAGRITNWREMGRTIFADIWDQSGRIQIFLNKKVLGNDAFKQLKLWDLGDWVGVEGPVFLTRTGELSIMVEKTEFLSKALRPLPDKHAGLTNPELIYRDRSAYFTSAPEERDHFLKRSQAISEVREFMIGRGYVEVDTPLMQPVYGGAAARPFTTEVHAIDETYYLQISPELYLKRLIAGGFEKVFTICKNFRNEGIDKTHNPEFTMMECYEAYADYNDMMALTEELYEHVFMAVNGGTRISIGEDEEEQVEIDFAASWPREKFLDMVHEHSGIDVSNLDTDALQQALLALPENHLLFEEELPREDVEKHTWGELVQIMFEFFCERHLIQPTFIIDHPVESTPLCKIHREDPRLIERFEPFAFGWELGNAYSELNDPIRQRELLNEQVEMGRGGDEEAHPLDEDFLAAVELGLPPTGGLGIGIDRMIMLLTNRLNIKDVILFPFAKSGKAEGEKPEES